MNPPTVICRKVDFFYLFYPSTLNIISFVEKNNLFLRFCLCISVCVCVFSRVPLLKVIMKYLLL